MYLPAEVLPAGVLLVELLPFGVLLVAEKEVVPAVFGFLEKREKIPPGSVILEEEVLLSSDALPEIWYSWHLFSSADWTGGHRHLCFWSLPMRRYANTKMEVCEYECNRCKNEIGTNERV